MIVKYKVRPAGKYVLFARNFVLSGFIPKVLHLGPVWGCSQSRAGRQTALIETLSVMVTATSWLRWVPLSILSLESALSARAVCPLWSE